MVDCLWCGLIVTKIGHSTVVVGMDYSPRCILCGQEDFSSEKLMTTACCFLEELLSLVGPIPIKQAFFVYALIHVLICV